MTDGANPWTKGAPVCPCPPAGGDRQGGTRRKTIM